MDNKKIQPTEQPQIVKILGPSGIWQAAIKGTYTRVWALIGCHKRGMDEWEILKSFPTITAAQLHDALSYYHDHKSEIDDFIEANERAIEGCSDWRECCRPTISKINCGVFTTFVDGASLYQFSHVKPECKTLVLRS